MVTIPCKGCISLPICISKVIRYKHGIDNILAKDHTIISSIRKTYYQIHKIRELFNENIKCSLFSTMMKKISYPCKQEYNHVTSEWEITYDHDTEIEYVFYELINIFHLNKVE